MTNAENNPDSSQRATGLREMLINQQNQINTLQKQLSTLNSRIAEILEDKVSRIDKGIQLQLEKFLARIKLQNDRLRERLKNLEDSQPATSSDEPVLMNSVSDDQKTFYKLLKEHETSIAALETSMATLKLERKQQMDEFMSNMDSLFRKIDISMKEVEINQQKMIKEQLKAFSADIDEKLTLSNLDRGREPAGAGDRPVASMETRLEVLAKELKRFEREGISSSVGLNLDFSDRLSEIERKLGELAARQSTASSPLGAPTADRSETKLKFYENVVTDLTNQLQNVIEKTSKLSAEVSASKEQESEIGNLRSAHDKMRAALSNIQLEHETLKNQIEERNRRIAELEKKVSSKSTDDTQKSMDDWLDNIKDLEDLKD